MLQHIKYNEYLPQAMEQLPRGAFLTVKSGDLLNTMTIGWGTIGYIWEMPIFTVAVRYSRHTYELINQAGEFTVSFPLDVSLKKELALCGTKSGRDMDKFQECGLTAQPAQAVATPVIEQCQLHYECRTVYKQTMEPVLLSPKIKRKTYSGPDYHTLYYGQILACYKQ